MKLTLKIEWHSNLQETYFKMLKNENKNQTCAAKCYK